MLALGWGGGFQRPLGSRGTLSRGVTKHHLCARFQTPGTAPKPREAHHCPGHLRDTQRPGDPEPAPSRSPDKPGEPREQRGPPPSRAGCPGNPGPTPVAEEVTRVGHYGCFTECLPCWGPVALRFRSHLPFQLEAHKIWRQVVSLNTLAFFSSAI